MFFFLIIVFLFHPFQLRRSCSITCLLFLSVFFYLLCLLWLYSKPLLQKWKTRSSKKLFFRNWVSILRMQWKKIWNGFSVCRKINFSYKTLLPFFSCLCHQPWSERWCRSLYSPSAGGTAPSSAVFRQIYDNIISSMYLAGQQILRSLEGRYNGESCGEAWLVWLAVTTLVNTI